MEAGANELAREEDEEEGDGACSESSAGQRQAGGGREAEPVVFCAVALGKEASAKEWKANLRWALANVARGKRLVLAHLHRPPSRINMMGAWVPVSQLAEEEVTAYRQLEEEKISKVLDDLLAICKSQKVTASKIVIASDDDTARGLIQLVDDHGVTELVMGAASDRAYTRKMRAPRSKKALTVQRKANPSCKIWFVCNGKLICTRDANEGEGLNRSGSSTTSTSPRSSTSDYSRSKSSRVHSEPFSTQESTDPTTSSVDHTPRREDNRLDRNIEDLNHRTTNIAGSSAPLSEIVEADKEPTVVQSLQEIEEELAMPSTDGSEAGDMDEALYEKLRDALMEAENLKREAYEETRRRQMAERDLANASKMADDAESSYQQTAKQRREVEEMLARERAEMERDRRELDEILDKIQKVNDRSAELELQIVSSERMMSDLEAKLSESYSILDALRRERRREDDPAAARESTAEESRDDRCGDQEMSFLRLGYSELAEATKHFDEAVRIDGGGGGGVYRGDLRDMAVAVKVFSPEVAVDVARFTREVEAISRVRHPNLVKLVGACPEARAVVHELVPGGSLEDRLGGESGSPPLPWHARCGVAYRACSALAFLHSTRPRATVHGDVRPANILLLDEQVPSCKLAGLGARRLVEHPDGGGVAVARPALAYADPQYLATGKLTPECDVYSLGVVLLRLVTGRPAWLARKAAQEAAAGGKAWHEVVDASAGGWPVERAREVALAALRCCDVERRPRRPGEALEEARSALEAATCAAPSRSPSSLSDGDGAPSYFLCPILKEVMRDPQIAGDGFTYEAEAIQEWLRGGHDTSPMTNLRLPTREVVPNHALRSAIHEWHHRHGRSQLDRLH